MATQFDAKKYVSHIPSGEFFLAGDIGGTNSNFGIFDMTDKYPRMLVSLHAKSQGVRDYAALINDLCEYVRDHYAITVREACLGAAGIINESKQSVSPTNLDITIDVNTIYDQSCLEKVHLINDFESVALGIDYIDQKDIVCVFSGEHKPKAHKACLGAGTGLGKAGLLWHHNHERYLPYASEGGHADFPAYNTFEHELRQFIQESGGFDCPVSWEHVLSGEGIKRIYQFLGTQKTYTETEVTKIIAREQFNPDKISAYAQEDERSSDTFRLYAQFYARCAKCLALDMLALNGIYIGGGIAAKNIQIFQNDNFTAEFMRCGAHSALLKRVPIYVIADYNVSLYGAAGFKLLYDQNIL